LFWTVSLVSKVVKYIKHMLELVRSCKYGAFIRIQTYVQPAWRPSMAVARLLMAGRVEGVGWSAHEDFFLFFTDAHI
jgi:hypothetical protein